LWSLRSSGLSHTILLRVRGWLVLATAFAAVFIGVAFSILIGVALLSGLKPEYRHFASAREEQEFLAKRLDDLLKQRAAEEICLVARTAKMLMDDCQSLLKAKGIPHTVLGPGNESGGTGVRLATMHHVKGLEFPVMIAASINAKVVPMRVALVEGDATAKGEQEQRERSLLFVAATRARDSLIVTSWGAPSPFLAGLVETRLAAAGSLSPPD